LIILEIVSFFFYNSQHNRVFFPPMTAKKKWKCDHAGDQQVFA